MTNVQSVYKNVSVQIGWYYYYFGATPLNTQLFNPLKHVVKYVLRFLKHHRQYSRKYHPKRINLISLP